MERIRKNVSGKQYVGSQNNKSEPFFRKTKSTVVFPSLKSIIQKKDEEDSKLNPKFPSGGGKLFSVKGDYLGETNPSGQAIIIIFDSQKRKEIEKEMKRVEKKGGEYKHEIGDLLVNEYFVLPPFNHRMEIKQILENDDGSSYQEFGGRGVIPVNMDKGTLDYSKFSHLRSLDGKAISPYDDRASIETDRIHPSEITEEGKLIDIPTWNFVVDYYWHSHPGGKWKKNSNEDKWQEEDAFNKREMDTELRKLYSGTTIGGSEVETKGFDLGPSKKDIENAHKRYLESKDQVIRGTEEIYPMTKNFVFHKREKKVFFYNQNTPKVKGSYNAKMDYETFFSLK